MRPNTKPQQYNNELKIYSVVLLKARREKERERENIGIRRGNMTKNDTTIIIECNTTICNQTV